MHIIIVIKVKADTEEDAISLVESELEDTVNSRAGFDYVGDVSILDNKSLSQNGYSSYKEMEVDLIKERESLIEEYLEKINVDVRKALLPISMPKRELPLMIKDSDEEFKEGVEKMMKNGESGKLPQSFDDLTEVVTSVIKEFSKKEKFFMPFFYMEKIKNIYQCLSGTDKYALLNTVDNPYADLTDETEGEFIYYVIADRHI